MGQMQDGGGSVFWNVGGAGRRVGEGSVGEHQCGNWPCMRWPGQCSWIGMGGKGAEEVDDVQEEEEEEDGPGLAGELGEGRDGVGELLGGVGGVR